MKGMNYFLKEDDELIVIHSIGDWQQQSFDIQNKYY
jgi:hypothetical protein